MPKHKQHHLTCRNDIGQYRKGDHIEEAGDVDALMASEHRHHFARVVADNGPESEPASPEASAAAMVNEATAK